MSTDTTTKRHRSELGQHLLLHREAVEHCEGLYLEQAGEVTDETEQAEAARDLTGRQALEALARYERHLDALDHQVAMEREALARMEASTAKRRAWADATIAALMETLAPGKTRTTAGVHPIALRHTTAVETTEGFDPAALPEPWRRHVPEKVIPARDELDKAAAKADLLLGYREGKPPAAGWYDVEGYGRLWLSQGARAWWASSHPDASTAVSLRTMDLSIEPEPGLDVLRWKPSPPGVSLVRRCHVKVG